MLLLLSAQEGWTGYQTGRLSGLGVKFDIRKLIRYLEIMKELAYEQKLYIIIASTDYIYGTNYSFDSVIFRSDSLITFSTSYTRQSPSSEEDIRMLPSID